MRKNENEIENQEEGKDNEKMATKMFSENAKKVLGFLQENPNVDLTAKELAEAIGVPPRSVNGVITSLSTRGFVLREPVVVDDKEVKRIVLTEEGKTVDINADKPE